MFRIKFGAGWWAAIAAVCALATSARAESSTGGEVDVYARPGFYFGLGGVYAPENFDFDSGNLGLTAILGPNVDPAYDNSAGAEIVIGYRTHPTLGFEFVYTFIEGFDSTAGTPETEIDGHLFAVSTKIYPFGGRLQPYVLAGLGGLLINSEVRSPAVKKPFQTDLGFTTRFGAGIDYYFTEHFALEVEGAYMPTVGGLAGHADYGTFGFHFLYRF